MSSSSLMELFWLALPRSQPFCRVGRRAKDAATAPEVLWAWPTWAATRGSRVRSDCTRASCAAKAGMERCIAASTQLPPSWRHHLCSPPPPQQPVAFLICRRWQCARRRLVDVCRQIVEFPQPPCPHHHHPLSPHHAPLLVQRGQQIRQCSCMASVSKAKGRREIMVVAFAHHF